MEKIEGINIKGNGKIEKNGAILRTKNFWLRIKKKSNINDGEYFDILCGKRIKQKDISHVHWGIKGLSKEGKFQDICIFFFRDEDRLMSRIERQLENEITKKIVSKEAFERELKNRLEKNVKLNIDLHWNRESKVMELSEIRLEEVPDKN